MQQARLLGITVVLSVMIWLVADHSLTEVATVRVRIHLHPAADNMRVALAEGQPPIVEVKLSGKRSQIDELRARAPLSVRLPVTARAAQTYRLVLAGPMRDAPELRDVDVQEVRPPTVDIEVDRDRTVMMPVLVRPGGALDYEIPPKVEPAEVAVTISERALGALPPGERVVLLNPDDYLETAPRGKLDSVSVPLTAIVGNVGVQLDPDFVTLRFKIRDRLKQTTISAVPIKIEASPDLFNGYRVEFRDASPILTQPLTIKGPPQLVDRVAGGELRIHGVIALTAANKAAAGSFQYVTPEFKLPEGIERVGPVEPVEFKLAPIKQSATYSE